MQHTDSFFNSLQHLRRVPLDVRTVTLGINISDCGNRQLHPLCESIYQRILGAATGFAEICSETSAEFGIPILQRRLQVTPIDRITQALTADDLVHVARTLDGAAAHVHADRIGGFVADVQHGLTSGARQLIESLPAAISQTTRVRAAVHVGTTEAGINMDAIAMVSRHILKLAEATRQYNGDGAGKLAILANDASGHPHLTNACLGDGWGDRVLHVGIGAASIIRHALESRAREGRRIPLQELAAEIQTAVFQAARAAEFIGRELASRLKAEFGTVDVTLAPILRAGDSVADLLPLLGIDQVGAPGTAAALVLLANAVRVGGTFGTTSAGSYSRVVMSVLEDVSLCEQTKLGTLSLDQLSMLSCAGAGGVDLIPIPGDLDPSTLAALIADQVALATYNRRPAAIRFIPVPGRKAGDFVTFSDQLQQAHVLSVHGDGQARRFIENGGRLPANR